MLNSFRLLGGKWKSLFKRLTGEGIYPQEFAFLLDNPIRKIIISPKALAKRLHLKPQLNVLELGCGPGYFSAEVTRNIYDGNIFLFDIQFDMLNKCKAKLQREKIRNAHFVQGNATSLPFKNNYFDRIFLVTVLGEVTNPEQCIESIQRVIRMGGILSITEMKGDPDILTIEQVKDLVCGSGFKYLELYNTLKGYTLNFIRSEE